MPSNVELRWTGGPKRAKAKQISDDVWKGYESEIREMYNSMTLEELAGKMRSIHGFDATLRQYIAHLELWGLKKCKTKSAAIEVMAEGNSQDTDLTHFSTALPGGFKRGRITAYIDDPDRKTTEGSPAGVRIGGRHSQALRRGLPKTKRRCSFTPNISALVTDFTPAFNGFRTISKDNTGGNDRKRCELMAMLGAKHDQRR